jgi:gas vesicle protein
MGNTNKLLGAVIIGAAIGGVLGVLFAPDKGSETRRKISEKGHDLSDAVKDKLNRIADKFRKEVDAIKEQANEYSENGKSVLETLEKS